VAERVLLSLTVDGAPCAVEVWPAERLLDVLRERLGKLSVKEGCGEGECGACAVLLDGRLVQSCLVPALRAQGVSVTTAEGLHGVAERFVAAGAVQCGFCTPGMEVAASTVAPGASEGAVREALSGNLCRCTGYQALVEGARR
jgi:aerobic-type carbon monoxide dehydrogenase small subunit (CoxS/CutS family)